MTRARRHQRQRLAHRVNQRLPGHRLTDAYQRVAHIDHFIQAGTEQISLLILGALGGRASMCHRKPSSVLQENEPLKYGFWRFRIAYQGRFANEIKGLGIVQGRLSKGEKNKKHQEKAEFVLSKTIKRYKSIKRLVQNLDSEIVKKKLIRSEKKKDIEQLEELERIHKQQIQPMIQSFENLERLYERKQIEEFEQELENFKALQEKITEKDLKKSGRKLKKFKP